VTRRNVLSGIAVIVLVAAGAIVIANRGRTAAPPVDDGAAAPSVMLYTARFGAFVPHVQAQGRVGPASGSDTRLPFAESGIVAAIDVHVGEAVVAGQALAELDAGSTGLDAAPARADAATRLAAAQQRLAAVNSGTASVQSDAAAADAAVEQSRAKIATDETAVAREVQLFAAGVAAAKDVEAARAQLTLDRADAAANSVKARASAAEITGARVQARADVAQAQADVRAAQRNLINATLRAPADGVVSAILKHVGEGADPTQPAVVLGPPTSNAVTLMVGPQAAGVRPGDPITMIVPARRIAGTGRVRAVVPATDPLTQTTTVIVAGAPLGAQPGDAIDATIALTTSERRGILIPTGAIVQDPQSGTPLVFVRETTKDGPRFTARTIVVGAGDERASLVTSGLRAGDRIAAQGAYDLLAPSGG
jgi:multidrug resistance efflux pump